jgi:hypothetical protein
MNNIPALPPGQDDPGVQALHRVASRQTVRSVKQTLLAAILVRAVRTPQPRWSNRFTVPTTVLITFSTEHWHLWQYLIHLVH